MSPPSCPALAERSEQLAQRLQVCVIAHPSKADQRAGPHQPHQQHYNDGGRQNDKGAAGSQLHLGRQSEQGGRPAQGKGGDHCSQRIPHPDSRPPGAVKPAGQEDRGVGNSIGAGNAEWAPRQSDDKGRQVDRS